MKRKVAFPFRHHAALVCPEAKQLLVDAGFELVENNTGRKLDRDEQKAMLADAYAVIAGTESYDADMLSACRELKVLVRFGVGTDNFDLKTLREKGVEVGVIANHNAVAEFALTLLLAALKSMPLYDAAVRNAGWNRYTMRELGGKTVGLVGFGRIGRRFAQLLSGFGVTLLAYDPYMNEEAARQMNVRPVDFETVLRESDIISLHLPLCEATRGIINAETIAKMKDGAVLVNTARGGLVKEEALVAALESGKLFSAALDVYETEPVVPGNPLYALKNCVLSPHVSALSIETNFEAGMTCARSVIRTAAGEKPVYPLW